MGRLFWKCFSFILFAQVIAAIAVGGAFWLKDRAREKSGLAIDSGPPALFTINAAAVALQYGGNAALAELIGNTGGHRQVFAVNDNGDEIFGRAVSPQLIADARLLLPGRERHPVVREVRSPDGQNYLLFTVNEDGPHIAPPMPQNGDNLPFPGGRHPPDGRPPSDFFPPMPLMPEMTAVVASLIFAALIAWYFSKPIENLRMAFKAAAAGNLESKVGMLMGRRSDELADLGRDFDSMANQLSSLMAGQRRLLHDVSHELRSPLARMQAAIGLARQQPGKVESSLERIERESVRMDRLLDELLTLSRLEASVAPICHEEIRMDDMIAEIVEDAQFEAEAKGCKVELTGHAGVAIQGQSELLHRAIENVVRNAIKHTADGSKVVVKVGADDAGKCFTLAVLDQGPGVPENMLSAIFEPFFRVHPAYKNADGHGLGLAIAQRVAHTHGGTIVATNRAEGGLVIEIVLPLPHRA